MPTEALPAVGNWLTNPSADVNNSGVYWNHTAGSSVNPTRIIGDGYRGTTCFEQSGVPDAIEGISKLSLSFGGSNAIGGRQQRVAVTPRQPVFCRAAFKAVAASAGAIVYLVNRYFISPGYTQVAVTYIGARYATEFTVGQWAEIEGWALAPAGVSHVQTEVWLVSTANPTTLRVTDGQIVTDSPGYPPYVGGPATLDVGTPFASPTQEVVQPARDTLIGVNDGSVLTHPFNPAARSYADQAAEAVALGVRTIRMGIPLGLDTAFKASGSLADLTWPIYDEIFDAYRAAGVKLSAIFAYSLPVSWRANPGAQNSPPSSARYSDFAQLCIAFLRRYRFDLAAIEIWNEPNLTSTLWPYADYVAALRVIYPAIKQETSLPVVLGGLTMALNLGANNYPTYLANCYSAGLKGYVDAVNIHPYAVAPSSSYQQFSFAEGLTSQLYRTRQAIAAAADTVPIWITEQGFSTTLAQAAPYATPLTQADKAAAWRLQFDHLARQADVRGLFFHLLVSQTLSAPDSGYNLFDNVTYARLAAGDAIAAKLATAPSPYSTRRIRSSGVFQDAAVKRRAAGVFA